MAVFMYIWIDYEFKELSLVCGFFEMHMIKIKKKKK